MQNNYGTKHAYHSVTIYVYIAMHNNYNNSNTDSFYSVIEL